MASTLPSDQNAPHTGTYLKSNAKEINFRMKTTKCDDSTYRQILAYLVDSSTVSRHAHEISGNGYSKKSAMPYGKRMRQPPISSWLFFVLYAPEIGSTYNIADFEPCGR